MAIFSQTVPAAVADLKASERRDNTLFTLNDLGVRAGSFTVPANVSFAEAIFTNVTIPPGSVINSATCDVSAANNIVHDLVSNIYCEDIDDAPDFTANPDVTNRSRTSASTPYTLIGMPHLSAVTSPDFSAAVQEVIDRPGWASGNNLGVIFEGANTGGNPICALRIDNNNAGPISITIDFAAPPAPPPPVARRTRFGSLGTLPTEISASGRFVLPGWFGHTTGTVVLVAGDLYYIPIIVGEQTSFDRIGINVSAAGAGGTLARLGIYEMRSDGLPGARLDDYGTVAVDSTGDRLITIPAIRQGRERGAYFLALVSNGAPTVSTFAATGFVPPISGQTATAAVAPDQVVLAATGQATQVTNGFEGPATTPTATRSGQFAAARLRGAS